jgi:hypothetical protein
VVENSRSNEISSANFGRVAIARNPRQIFCFSALQKHSRIESVGGIGFDDEKAELGGLFLEETNLLFPVPILVVLQTLIDVLVPPLQHAIDEASELVSHRGDGIVNLRGPRAE